MLAITDARFLEGLVARAKKAGKLRAEFSVPDRWRQNTPARLQEALRRFQACGLFADFPFGSDFTAEERRLLPALQRLNTRAGRTPREGARRVRTPLPDRRGAETASRC